MKPLDLLLVREPGLPADTFTKGLLYANGVQFCFTLEDKDRKLETMSLVEAKKEKVHGQTAIPRGCYPVTVDMSNRFKRLMPLVQNVPYFAGVRIHTGNTDADTDGCIIVGTARGRRGTIVGGSSGPAFRRLMTLIEGTLDAGLPVTLEIR